jgi:5-methylcytosine-specific restriction endonuclease McrA
MKICPKCGDNHEKPGTFCSRKCANSRQWTAEINERRRISNKRSAKDSSYKANVTRIKNFMEKDFDSIIGIQSKRKRVILEQRGRCNRCGLDEWQGETLTLELDHKNGIREDNARTNLEGLCPNCHSLTPTWRGRKNGSLQKQVERLLEYAASRKE